MLADVVASIPGARSPIYKEHILLDAVTYPVKAHVDGFGSLLFEAGVGKADGRRVVDLDRGGWLGMSHFLEANAERDGVSSGKEGGADFRLCSGAHDILHDFGEDMDDSVGEGHGGLGGIRKLVAEEVDCGSAATGLRLGEVGSVAMDVKDHVGGYVAEGGRRMAGCVAEEVG